MEKTYIVAFKCNSRNEVVAFDDEATRDAFVTILKANNYSYCTTTATVKH